MKPWTSCDLDRTQASTEGFACCKGGTSSAGKRVMSAKTPRAVLLTGQSHPQNATREEKTWQRTLQGLRNAGISLEVVNGEWGIWIRNKSHGEHDPMLQDYSKEVKFCRQRVGFGGLCTPPMPARCSPRRFVTP